MQDTHKQHTNTHGAPVQRVCANDMIVDKQISSQTGPNSSLRIARARTHTHTHTHTHGAPVQCVCASLRYHSRGRRWRIWQEHLSDPEARSWRRSTFLFLSCILYSLSLARSLSLSLSLALARSISLSLPLSLLSLSCALSPLSLSLSLSLALALSLSRALYLSLARALSLPSSLPLSLSHMHSPKHSDTYISERIGLLHIIN